MTILGIVKSISAAIFPSIFDANSESAIWFIDNSMPESAKSVIRNIGKRIERLEMSNSEIRREALSFQARAIAAEGENSNIREALASEMDNSQYWRNKTEIESRHTERLIKANDELWNALNECEATANSTVLARNEAYATEIMALNSQIESLKSKLAESELTTLDEIEAAIRDCPFPGQ
jgi:hypothetical protein